MVYRDRWCCPFTHDRYCLRQHDPATLGSTPERGLRTGWIPWGPDHCFRLGPCPTHSKPYLRGYPRHPILQTDPADHEFDQFFCLCHLFRSGGLAGGCFCHHHLEKGGDLRDFEDHLSSLRLCGSRFLCPSCPDPVHRFSQIPCAGERRKIDDRTHWRPDSPLGEVCFKISIDFVVIKDIAPPTIFEGVVWDFVKIRR